MMLNKSENTGLSENRISTLLKCIEAADECDTPQTLLQALVDLVVASDLADKCMAMAMESSMPASRVAASCGLSAPELESAQSYIEEQAQQLADTQHSKNASVVIVQYGAGMNALLSLIRGRNECGILVLSIRSDDRPAFAASDVNYMAVLVNILKLSLGKSKVLHADPAAKDEILNAKQEWEFSVNNMQELMCLLDENGRVIRANKTLERWRLGDVRSVKGSTVHEIMHPDCEDGNCCLDNAWKELWGRSMHSQFEICELYDRVRDSNIRLSLRRGEEGEQGQGFVMLVIEDVSESKWEERLLEIYTEELYRQVQNQSMQLAHANSALHKEVRQHHQDKESLRKSRIKLQTLSAKLLTAQEEERKRISAELHDGIGQSISAIKFGMENMLLTTANSESGVDTSSIQTMIGRLQDTVEEVRRISMGLRPSMLDDLGLLPTLIWFCREYQLTFNSIKIKQVFDFDEQEMPATQKLVIFRIVQEALNNIGKYSEADAVSVRLTTEKDLLVLVIEDNGVGFEMDDKQVARGFGLGSMRERAKMSDGVLRVDSTIGQGTSIRAVWLQSHS